MRRHLAEALDVLWPVSCAGCGAPASAVCDTCLADWEPRHERLHDVPLTTLGHYEGELRAAVLACKEQGSVAVARRLGQRLAAACAATDAVAVVPPSAAGLRRRGFHAAHWIARSLQGRIGQLRFDADGGTQKRLGRDERIGADRQMRAPKWLAGRSVIALDDVVTTGATMLAAVAAIEAAGGRVERIAALAHTPLRHRLGLGDQRR